MKNGQGLSPILLSELSAESTVRKGICTDGFNSRIGSYIDDNIDLMSVNLIYQNISLGLNALENP